MKLTDELQPNSKLHSAYNIWDDFSVIYLLMFPSSNNGIH